MLVYGILFFSLCLTGTRAVVASWNEFGSVPSSSVFCRSLRGTVLILLQIFVGSSSGTIWRFLSGKFLNWELSFLDTHMAPHYPCHVGRVRPAVALFACFLCFFVPLFSFSCLSLGNLNSFLEFHFKFSIVYY